jgi:hypothetical protein
MKKAGNKTIDVLILDNEDYSNFIEVARKKGYNVRLFKLDIPSNFTNEENGLEGLYLVESNS